MLWYLVVSTQNILNAELFNVHVNSLRKINHPQLA